MGTPQLVGSIYGNGFRDAVFQYSRDYITSENSLPISVFLPFSENPFSTEETKCFFEGLLRTLISSNGENPPPISKDNSNNVASILDY